MIAVWLEPMPAFTEMSIFFLGSNQKKKVEGGEISWKTSPFCHAL